MTPHTLCWSVIIEGTLSFYLQAVWRNLTFSAHTDPVEMIMQTTVTMVDSAYSPKTLTNLPACKKCYLSPCVPWMCFSKTLLHIYMYMLVRVHLWNALTNFPAWSAAARPHTAGNAASSSVVTLAVRLKQSSSSPSVLGYSCSSLPWPSASTALSTGGEYLQCCSSFRKEYKGGGGGDI